jgi:type I restriction enzyme R subunit
MAIRYTYSTNGQGIYGIDIETGKEVEAAAYPTPDELWNLTFAWQTPGVAASTPTRTPIEGHVAIRFY